MEPTATTHGGFGDSPPFWPPSTSRSRRRYPPTPFQNPSFVFVILPIILFLLTLFLVPTFFGRKSQIAKPSTTNNTKGGSVKKTWDLFNVLLVLFAVLCGIFAKKTANDDNTSSTTGASDDVRNMSLMKSGEQFGGVLSSNQWFDGGDDNRNHHHRFFFDTRVPERSHDVVVNQLRMRNGGLVYSDLRHDSVEPMNGSDERFKFFDDFDINRYRTLEINNNVVPVHRRRQTMGELSEFKPVPVDKFVVTASTEAPPLPSESADEGVTVTETVPPPLESANEGVTVTDTVPPPLAPISPPVRKSRKHTYRRSASRKVDVQKRASSPPPATSSPPPPTSSPPPATFSPPPPTSSPPPPPPEAVTLPPLEVEDVKLKKKKKSINATKEIKTVLASIYNPVKRKKYKTKVIIDDSLGAQPDLPVDSSPPSMQPPPPPPPPLPSVFKLFKQSSKNKKIHSVPPPAPPPPPRHHHRQNTPLPPPISHPQSPPPQRASLSQRRKHSTTTGRPPLPNKSSTSSNNADNESLSNNSGGQSPLIPMPPPPPLPPFQMSAMKFTVNDDYVPVKSGPSTRCNSPELNSSLKESSSSSNVMDDGDVIAQQSSMFCPSPDVNMKADTFIARLRDEWKNDKINSMKGKQKLGRVPGSNSIN